MNVNDRYNSDVEKTMNSTDRMEGTARSAAPAAPIKPAKPTAVIAITGLARSGKDTVADMLYKILSVGERREVWNKHSFAAPIKTMLSAGLGLVDKDPRAEEVYGVNYRTLAQTLGTEWGRELINPDLWLNITAIRMAGKRGIISDLRMENEAAWVRSVGGIVIHLERKGQKVIEESAHKTEAGIDRNHNDYMVYNNGDLEYLQETCKAVAKDMREMLAHKIAWGLEDALGLAHFGSVPDPDKDYDKWLNGSFTEYEIEIAKLPGGCCLKAGRVRPDYTNPRCLKCQSTDSNSKTINERLAAAVKPKEGTITIQDHLGRDVTITKEEFRNGIIEHFNKS